MSKYEEAMKIMAERFGKDELIAIATNDGSEISNRMVDAYFEDGAFYVVTYAESNKMKQIKNNSNVAICAIDWFTGNGVGENIGWVLDPKNADIRTKLREVFAAWYDHANDEQDKNCCFLKIHLTRGVLIKDHHAIRYDIDFMNKTVEYTER